MLAYPKKSDLNMRNDRAIEQQFILFILEYLSILVERKPAPWHAELL